MPEVQNAADLLKQITDALELSATQSLVQNPHENSYMEVWGWNMPGISKYEFAQLLRSVTISVDAMSKKEVSVADFQTLSLYPGRIQYFTTNALQNLPGGHAQLVYATAQSIVEGLRSILSKYIDNDFTVKLLEHKSALPAQQIKKLLETEKKITKIQAESDGLEGKIRAINDSHSAAELLPETMSSLNEAIKDIDASKLKAVAANSEIDRVAKSIVDALERIKLFEIEAASLVGQTKTAKAAAVTEGLGAAFAKRASNLTATSWGLSVALAITLGIGAYLSAQRIEFVHTIMKQPSISLELLWVNVSLTLISVGGPIWFAWFLTKQIGHRFRMAEDYGFKASIAKAYEGYLSEAKKFGDPELEKRLFSLALDRLEEPPLRFVERATPGTPMQEILGSLFDRETSSRSKATAED
jgi:hypothetical protein